MTWGEAGQWAGQNEITIVPWESQYRYAFWGRGTILILSMDEAKFYTAIVNVNGEYVLGEIDDKGHPFNSDEEAIAGAIVAITAWAFENPDRLYPLPYHS